jgi:hypothetical protein
MTLKQHPFTALALVLIMAGILAPTASAQPIDQLAAVSLPASSSGQSATASPQVLPNPDNQQPSTQANTLSTPTQVRIVPTAPNAGFDWSDAAIGAGAAFALIMMGIGGVLVLNNRRHREARPATTA